MDTNLRECLRFDRFALNVEYRFTSEMLILSLAAKCLLLIIRVNSCPLAVYKTTQ